MTLTDFLSGIANAIRQKTGSSNPIPAQKFVDEILGIQTGTDTSDATATSDDILSGKTAYGADGKLTGTIKSKASADVTFSGPTVTVPAGHYPSVVQKSIQTVEQGTPSISVSSLGLITATASQESGYVSGGEKSNTLQLQVQTPIGIRPGTSEKVVVPANRYTTGDVTVAGDANLISSNIKSGVSIFGVSGSAEVLDTPTARIVIRNQSYDRMYVMYQEPGFTTWQAASPTRSSPATISVPVGGWIYAYSDGVRPYIFTMLGCSTLGPGSESDHNAAYVTSTTGSITFDTM